MKAALLLLLKAAVTALLLGLLFREHRGTLLAPLEGLLANPGWTCAGLAAAGGALLFAALRWQAVLRGQGLPLPLAELGRLIVIAAFFNTTSLGVVGGDAWRALALLRRPGTPRLPVVVSILLDHLVGLVSLALIFLACAWAVRDCLAHLDPVALAAVQGFAVFMIGTLVTVAVTVVASTPAVHRRLAARLAGGVFQRPALQKFVEACDALRRAWRQSLLALGHSLLLFACHFGLFYCGLRAVGGEAPLVEFLAAMPVIDAAAGLPVSVSGLGVRETTFEILVGGLTGLAAPLAVAASLAGWLFTTAWGLLGGLLFVAGRRVNGLQGFDA
jgi:glycosyltransferase 2 family protein